jgi:hypothetical protein
MRTVRTSCKDILEDRLGQADDEPLQPSILQSQTFNDVVTIRQMIRTENDRRIEVRGHLLHRQSFDD